MNIIKLQNELRGVPDDALIGYVQNPTGNVPSYLALSELQRRKDMRTKYEAQQAPESSVADDLEKQAQPQPQGIAAMPQAQPQETQGVAGLPIPDQMFSDQGMAAGGIVAFDDGGEVPSFAGPNGSAVYAPDFNVGEMPEESTFGQMFRRLTNVPTAKESLDIDAELNRLSQERAKYGVNPFSSISKEDRAFKKQKQQEYTDKMNQLFEQKKNLGKPGGYVPTESPMKSPEQVQADQAQAAQTKALQDKEKALKDMAAANAVSSKGDREGTKSLSDYAKEFRDVVGEDPMQAKLAARMEKMDTASAKQAERAPWMALAQAGFGIAAGKSPYALQNIAAGAMEGVKSYGDAQDKMAALEDKRFALMADMAKAQRAEQLAIASKGVDSRDAQLARNATEKLNDKKMAADMQIHLLDNAFELKKTQLTTAAKDLPNATERATKIKPLVMEHPTYKPRIKALIARLGDKSVEDGSPKNKEYRAGVQAIESEIYNELISRPGASAGTTMNYVPGKGFSF
jgi:hypothetical protein